MKEILLSLAGGLRLLSLVNAFSTVPLCNSAISRRRPPNQFPVASFFSPRPLRSSNAEDDDNESLDYSTDYDDTDESTLLVEGDAASMGAWVPIGSVSCLQGLDPLAMDIMGRSFVVWRDPAKDTWSVLTDECPHRMAPLSQGRIDPATNCLECPYHGWQFNATGTLVRIPHLDEKDAASASQALSAPERSVESYATHLTGDLLWAFLPTSFHGESFPRTLLPEHYYRGLADFVQAKATYYTQEMPFSFDFFVENVLDGPAHAYFAHHAFGFRRDEVKPLPVKIPISNFTDLSTEVSYLRHGVERRRRYGYQRPFLLMNQQPSRGGDWKTAILFFAVPIREGKSRLITTFDTLSPHPRTPDWILHVINQKFLEGDFIVHPAEYAIRHKLSVVPKYIYATSSDTSVKAWRSWWTKYGLSAAPPQTFGPANPRNLHLLDRRQLSDAWTYHTRHCRKCRTALRRLRLCRAVSVVLSCAALAGAVARGVIRHRWVCWAATVLGAAAWAGSARLIQELEGPSSHSQVGDRSLSATL